MRASSSLLAVATVAACFAVVARAQYTVYTGTTCSGTAATEYLMGACESHTVLGITTTTLTRCSDEGDALLVTRYEQSDCTGPSTTFALQLSEQLAASASELGNECHRGTITNPQDEQTSFTFSCGSGQLAPILGMTALVIMITTHLI